MACRKLAFRSPEAAERTMAIMAQQGLAGREAVAPSRLYLCPKCDLWHWTKQARSHDGAPSVEVVAPARAPTVVAVPPPEPDTIKATKPKRQAPPVVKPSTSRQQVKIIELEARNAALVRLVAAIKDHLRPAAAGLATAPGPDSILDAICAMDAVTSLPRMALEAPARHLAERAVEKRKWLADHASRGGR